MISKKKHNNDSSKEYWKNKIQKGEFLCPEIPIIIEKDESEDKVTFYRKKMLLENEEYTTLKNTAAQNGVTVSNAILAAYAAVLGRWSSNKQMCINVTLMQRSESEMEIIGDFTSVDMLSGLFAFLEPRKSVECTAGHLEEAEVNKLKRICTQRFENINREDFMKWKKQSDKAALADMFQR